MKAQNMKRWGPLLIGVGVVILLLNSRLFSLLPSLLWLAILVAVAFLLWIVGSLPIWARFAGLLGLYVFAMATTGALAGVAALGFPALVFAMIYLANIKRWWAILPAGILGSLALFLTFEQLFPHWDGVPILFLGWGAMFTLLYLLPKQRGGQSWALYPAIGLIIVTVLVNDPTGGGSGWWLPFILIAGGSAMLWWWRRNRRS